MNTHNSYSQDSLILINPGVSAGKFYLGKTTLKGLKDSLKIKKYIVIKEKEKLKNRTLVFYKVVLNTAEYKDISFDIFDKKTNPIVGIIIPDKYYNAKTIDGIAIGKSTRTDVNKIYGNPNRKVNHMYEYVYRGISFSFSDTTNLVKEIVIYTPVKKL